MRIANAIVLLGAVIMGITLLYGFAVGDFMGEGAQLLSMPWGIVSLVDVYVMFTLFSMWIVYREKSIWRSVIWVALVMVLGSVICCIYALLALLTCGGDSKRLWMGRGWEGSAA